MKTPTKCQNPIRSNGEGGGYFKTVDQGMLADVLKTRKQTRHASGDVLSLVSRVLPAISGVFLPFHWLQGKKNCLSNLPMHNFISCACIDCILVIF